MRKLIIIVLTMLPVVVQAQRLTPSEERQIRLKVVDLMEEYEKYSSMDLDFADFGPSFRSLFVSGQSKVYNDLNNVVRNEELTVSEYIKILTEKSTTTRSVIKNVECSKFNTDRDEVEIICSFDKYVNITNECGVEYSSEYFNASDYHETAKIIYDRNTKSCLIDNITGYVETVRTLPNDYRVIKLDRDAGYHLTCAGKVLQPNAMHQVFVPIDKEIMCDDRDLMVKMKEINKDCKLWSASVKPVRFRVKPYYEMAMKEVYNITDAKNFNECKSSGYNLGIDFGYSFPSKSAVKIAAYLGLGMSNSTMDMGVVKNGTFSYSTNADVDGDTYQRRYKDLTLKQTVKVSDLIVPLYLDFDVFVSPVVSLFADAGGILHFNMSHKIGNTEGNAYVDGLYGTEYGNLLLNESWGFNGFGYQTYGTSNLAHNEVVDFSGISVDVFGRAGLRINIPKSPISIDLAAQYTYGLTNVINNRSNPVSLVSPNVNTTLVFNTINGLQSSEHVRNLTQTLSPVKRQGLKLHVGMIFKF